MSYLVDTNVISEVQKGSRANSNVSTWWKSTDSSDLFLSVVVIGEIYRGIERLALTDPNRGQEFFDWIQEVIGAFEGRILGIDLESAIIWGKLTSGRSIPLADALLAATALSRNMTLITRNTRDIHDTGVRYVNPFEDR